MPTSGWSAVHPHACGADAVFVEANDLGVRFIPTRVGQTQIGPQEYIPHAVHPHACGADVVGGSAVEPGLRLIPTRVGQTHRKQ